MHIVTLGDVMLDVVVNAPDGLREDDDTEARIGLYAGGQAANVATWAVALGAEATLVGPRAGGPAGDFVHDRLVAAGVRVHAVETEGTGTVVSILSGLTRTLASDAADQSWVGRLDDSLVPTPADWLHVSAYPLLRAADPGGLLAFVDAVRRRGVSVSLDLSSAGLITAYGPGRFADVVRQLSPRVVFANASEWDALGLAFSDLTADVVVKHGGDGVTTVEDGEERRHAAASVDVVDLTGAGDALAAGYLVGGVALGLATAARCVAQPGAQPPPA
jgi:sugar/nucleoside kinase (ribokinase family)